MKHLFKNKDGFSCDILRVEENGQVKWYDIDRDGISYVHSTPSPITDEFEQEYQQIKRDKILNDLGI